ncbi:MAG: hypothetical protein ACJA0E_001675 [Bermanella sp.]|jgi:hypothetical protein
MNLYRSLLLITALFSSISSFAQDPNEPSIVISHAEDKTFYEYTINGQLVEIKVVPKVGPTYYLVPSDSDDMTRKAKSSLTVPKWVIFSW